MTGASPAELVASIAELILSSDQSGACGAKSGAPRAGLSLGRPPGVPAPSPRRADALVIRSRSGGMAEPSIENPGCSSLHLEMQFMYNANMSTSTVGFAVADEDRDRLARLVDYFGGGNRSAYLRATLAVMESLARAERLRELQARNAERAAAAGQDYEQLLAEVRRAYKDGARKR